MQKPLFAVASGERRRRCCKVPLLFVFSIFSADEYVDTGDAPP